MERILQTLDAQWLEVAGSPAAQQAVRRWAGDHPLLDRFADLHEVVACRRDPETVHDVLLVLARFAPTDDLAARTVLQMLLPGIVRLVGTVGHGDPDAQDELVAIAFERIRTYPTTRNGSVAANVVLDVRKRYLQLRRTDNVVPMASIAETADERVGPEDHVLGVLLIEEIADAQRDGMMSGPVLDAIMRTRLGGERLRDVASEQGIEPELLCLRRWRAERRLRSLALAG